MVVDLQVSCKELELFDSSLLIGQAQALSLAIAKGLVIQEPKLLHSLGSMGYLNMDLRRVERKKPGQKKARKKFAWVKR
jgi:small subunit ribosomal protein S9